MCSCCVVSGNPFLPLLASVGVASSWTLLATTGQLAEEQECWVAEPSHWKALQHVFAVRQVPVSPQTSWWTLTWCLKSVWMVVDWKLSQTGFHYSMEPNLPWTTMVAPLKRDTPQPDSVDVDGAALVRARRRKERVYPELTGRHGRARLVVLACETGGRWSSETQCFLRQAAKAKTRHEPPPLRTSARLAWLLRWSTMLACSGARALAFSLMELRTAVGHDGPTPFTAEVIGEARYAGFV